jgi:protein TonB
MWVGPDGLPIHLHVVQGAGDGLDESAMESVRSYRFEPAKENGTPVAVRIKVEVEFRIY